MEYLGHSQNGNGDGVSEPLRLHLLRVAARTASFAKVFGAEQQGWIAGILHDLGKYADRFQTRLRDPRIRAGDHSAAGAFWLAKLFKERGCIPSLAIQGHHGGLRELVSSADLVKGIYQRLQIDAETNEKAFTDTNVIRLFERWKTERFELSPITDGLQFTGKNAADMLDVRMLFSALVDADFLETEAHFAGNVETPYVPRDDGAALNPRKAFDDIVEHVSNLASNNDANSPIQMLRSTLFEDCIRAGESCRPGVFTLSAPTGAGKTLSMLAFALRHAMEHNLRRIVLVMPFLNIIDQTAKTYRDRFSAENGYPEHYVIEDHSNVNLKRDKDDAEKQRREREQTEDNEDESVRIGQMLSQNWDAPIVLTTTVQCLESLMSNRTSACRKLHRLANSVILFDEVQTLPPNLAVPTLATLSRLSERFGASVVFSTATQPAFDHLYDQVAKLAPTGWKPTEIVKDTDRLFSLASGRTRVKWDHEEEVSWEQVASEITQVDQVLVIVNLKRHAQQLAGLVGEMDRESLFHLSTSMCTDHRKAVLDEVRRRLKSNEPVRLISTQCVEAGVDVDFPTVFRSLAPLEAIAQAAGRCNRHGTRPTIGDVRVFRPARDDGKVMYPPGGYAGAANATAGFLKAIAEGDNVLERVEILNAPDRLRKYFQTYYTLTGVAATKESLAEAISRGNFETVANKYQLIEKNTISVLVPYDVELFKELCDEIQDDRRFTAEEIRKWTQRARATAVGVYRPTSPTANVWSHVEPIRFGRELSDEETEWFWLLTPNAYDELLGLCIEEQADMIV